MKIVIVGGSHAGIAASKFIKQLSPKTDVTIIEKSSVLGFIPSTVNLIFQGMIPSDEIDLGETTGADMLLARGINVLMETEVIEVLPKQKQVKVIEYKTNNEQFISYDYLILAMGSEEFTVTGWSPNSSDDIPFLTYKKKPQTLEAYNILKDSQHIGIIGAGLISLELASSLSKHESKQITLIEQMNTPLFRYFDPEMSELLLQYLPDSVKILFHESYRKIIPKDQQLEIELFSGETLTVDTCVYGINPKPNVHLVQNILSLEFDSTLTINNQMQTSDPYIYAIGDLVRIPFGPHSEKAYLPLIANARRTALIAACNIVGIAPQAIPASQRTIGTELFGIYLGSTGLTKEEATFYDYQTYEICKTYDTFSKYHLPKDFSLTIKLLVSEKDDTVLGAQLLSTRRDMLDLINIFAQIIMDKKEISQLVFSDMFFSPQLSPSINFIADLGLESLVYKQNTKQ